jgi:CHASE2 domain-containing sensor protein
LQSSLDPLRQLWRLLSDKQQRFISNALVALITFAALGFLDQSHWLLRLENSAMDTMMEFNKGLGRMSGHSGARPLRFTFLDIDEDSYRTWYEPYHTPRDKLLRLIDFAAGSGAQLIVVDIDLSKPGINPDHDRALAEYLSGYGALNSPPIVLVRSFHGESSEQDEWHDIRPSFLDAYELPESVHWGHPLFQTTLWDGVVRHWSLARLGCRGGHMELVPSIQLTAAALLSHTAGSNRVADIEAIGLVNCEQQDGGAATIGRYNPGFESGIGQRLIFTIAWNQPAPDLITIPASVVTESDEELADDLLNGRIVLIGASYAGSGDIHRTPIGEMPGALIVINAIKSLISFGQLREPPVWITLLLQVGCIVLAAWAFSRFDSFIAVGITGAITIAFLVPVTFYVFKHGLWVGFSIPLLAMLIHRGVAEYRDVRQRSRNDPASAGRTG